MNKVIKKGIFAPDIHYPLQDKESMNILMKFTKKFKPDYFIFGGDQMDMESISFYNKNKPKLLENKRLIDDYNGFQNNVLDKVNDILPEECEKYFMIGNHEYRVVRLIETDTQYEGFIELENNLDLSDYKVIDYNGFIQLGHMVFIHGIKYNTYFAKYNLLEYNENIFCGHVHKLQMFTKCSPLDGNPKIGVGVPCLCDTNPQWKRGEPNDWMHGFLYFYLHEDGNFTFYIPIIVDGKVVINDKVYHG